MDDDEPGVGLPPEWVALSDAAKWVESQIGIPANEIEIAIKETVRDRIEIRHRVGGLNGHISAGFLPKGVDSETSYGKHRYYVKDWEAAAVDRNFNSIAGFRDNRLPIEVYWPELRRWAEMRNALRLHKASKAERQSNFKLSPPTAKAVTIGEFGRPNHKALDPFVRELIRLADLDGLPAERGGLYKHMTNWLSVTFGDDVPSETTVKDWLRRFDWRKHATPQMDGK